MSEADPLLRVRGVSMRFGGLQALEDVSFDVMRGEILALIGPNSSREHPHQRRRASAVAAEQSNTLAGLDMAMDTIQEGRATVPQMHITKSNKWHNEQDKRSSRIGNATGLTRSFRTVP